jgi:hypothetical protein
LSIGYAGETPQQKHEDLLRHGTPFRALAVHSKARTKSLRDTRASALFPHGGALDFYPRFRAVERSSEGRGRAWLESENERNVSDGFRCLLEKMNWKGW